MSRGGAVRFKLGMFSGANKFVAAPRQLCRKGGSLGVNVPQVRPRACRGRSANCSTANCRRGHRPAVPGIIARADLFGDQTSEPSEHSAAAERIAVTRPSVVLGKRVATTRCGVVVLPCVSWLSF